MAMIGQRATAHEVKARWAYTELNSTRFGHQYPSGPLTTKAKQSVPFDTLSSAEQDDLVRLLPLGRTSGFASSVDQHPDYTCEGWDRTHLAMAWTICAYGPRKAANARYLDFYFGKRDTGPHGESEDSDARVQADKIAQPAVLDFSEPAIILGSPGSYILLEGYLRSVLFMRDATPSQRFLVWVPIANIGRLS